MCPNPQKTADLVTFTEEILNGKLHFLYKEGQVFPNLPTLRKFQTPITWIYGYSFPIVWPY